MYGEKGKDKTRQSNSNIASCIVVPDSSRRPDLTHLKSLPPRSAVTSSFPPLTQLLSLSKPYTIYSHCYHRRLVAAFVIAVICHHYLPLAVFPLNSLFHPYNYHHPHLLDRGRMPVLHIDFVPGL